MLSLDNDSPEFKSTNRPGSFYTWFWKHREWVKETNDAKYILSPVESNGGFESPIGPHNHLGIMIQFHQTSS